MRVSLQKAVRFFVIFSIVICAANFGRGNARAMAGVKTEGEGINGVIVYNAAELTAQLQQDLGEEVIYLGNDITIPEGGIPVSNDRGNFILDGKNPETGNIHTLTEHNADREGANIFFSNQEHTSNQVMVRNMKIAGATHWGIIGYRNDASINRTLFFQNVEYTGPQLTVMRYGTVIFEDTDITIQNGYTRAGKAAELSKAIFRSQVNLNQKEEGMEAFFVNWNNAAGVDAGIVVESGAEVAAAALPGSQKASFCDSEADRCDIALQDNASLVFHGQGAFTGNNSITGLTVGAGAKLDITVDGLSKDLINLRGDMVISAGAEVSIVNHGNGSNSLLCLEEGGNFYMNNPAKAILINPSHPILQSTSDDSTFSVVTSKISYWEQSAAGGETDKLKPLYIWTETGTQLIEMQVSGSNGQNFTIVNANYQIPEQAEELAAAEAQIPLDAGFCIETCRMLLMEGRQRGDIAYGQEERTGSEPELFLEVPQRLSFETTAITGQVEIIKRAGESAVFNVNVYDRRTVKSGWKLSVRATPFYKDDEENVTLSHGVIFVDEGGNSHSLASDYVIDTKAGGGDASYSWKQEEGFYAVIDTSEVSAGSKYRTNIIWNLSDVP